MNKLFQPLNGACPHCNGTVNIIEGLVYDYTLDKEGLPEFMNSEEYRVAAYCKRCEKCLFVAPNSVGGYTVYPDNNAIPMMLHQAYARDGRLGRSSILGIKLLEKEDNPFINICDDDECPF